MEKDPSGKKSNILIFIGWFLLVSLSFLLFISVFTYAFFPDKYHFDPGWPALITMAAIALITREALFSKHKNLAEFYTEINNFERALRNYKLAIRLKPGNAVLYNNIGNLFTDNSHFELAVKSYENALNIKPDYDEGYRNLARLYLLAKNYVKTSDYFDKAYRMKRGYPVNEAHEYQKSTESKEEQLTVTRHKIIHDIEQIDYLIENNLINESYLGVTEIYKVILEKTDPGKFLTTLEKEDSSLIKPYWNRNIYIHKMPDFDKPAINPKLDYESIQDTFFTNPANYVYFDNFLKEEVLQELYKFCLRSSVWNDYRKTGGYVGSYMDDGFNNITLYEIAEELREKFSAIFGESNLLHMWGYKYDSKMSGIPAHADEAKINVNFWLTPDYANLDPSSGGLIIYDKEAPKDWDFKSYNAKTDKVYGFLKESEAKKIKIPYRCNRAVIFKSNLFHETEAFSFKEDYETRRINVTMLFV